MKHPDPQTSTPSGPPAQDQLQYSLVLPLENSDDHPLMKKYAMISEQALKNTPPTLQNDLSEDLHDKLG
jgi:hypothetical protein